ncbi:hypothetical protein [Haloarchaeobius sp. TZWSO28]|uniref:hypothetical protein n=1 Tax=Haloarchaeobius sp. TZWSO28 TaxID=3446119 RepID=UPI003EB97817
MATMNKGRSPSEQLRSWLGGLTNTVKKSFNLLIATAGILLFVFAGTVLVYAGHDVWAGLLAISGLLTFAIGLSGYLIYRLLSRYY